MRGIQLLPAFHVMPLSNLSAEAEALAGRLPAALPDSVSGGDVSVDRAKRRLYSVNLPNASEE